MVKRAGDDLWRQANGDVGRAGLANRRSGRLSIRQVPLCCQRVANQTIVVEGQRRSGELAALWTNIINESSAIFTDPQWTNYPARFYRAGDRFLPHSLLGLVAQVIAQLVPVIWLSFSSRPATNGHGFAHQNGEIVTASERYTADILCETKPSPALTAASRRRKARR